MNILIIFEVLSSIIQMLNFVVTYFQKYHISWILINFTTTIWKPFTFIKTYVNKLHERLSYKINWTRCYPYDNLLKTRYSFKTIKTVEFQIRRKKKLKTIWNYFNLIYFHSFKIMKQRGPTWKVNLNVIIAL